MFSTILGQVLNVLTSVFMPLMSYMGLIMEYLTSLYMILLTFGF